MTYLATIGYSLDEGPDAETVQMAKEKVCKELVRFLDRTFYVGSTAFYGIIFYSLVLLIILPIVYELKRKTGWKTVKLFRPKQITSMESETGGLKSLWL